MQKIRTTTSYSFDLRSNVLNTIVRTYYHVSKNFFDSLGQPSQKLTQKLNFLVMLILLLLLHEHIRCVYMLYVSFQIYPLTSYFLYKFNCAILGTFNHNELLGGSRSSSIYAYHSLKLPHIINRSFTIRYLIFNYM